MRRLTIICDGGCAPNNPGGYGLCAFVVYEGKVSGREGAERPAPLHQQRGCIGYGDGMTNNLSEYRSVRAALRWVEKYAADDRVDIYTDSKLVVQTANGRWGCNAPHLIPLRNDCQKLLAELPGVKVHWVPREETFVADCLVREAYEEAIRRAA